MRVTHSFALRFAHWLFAIAILVLSASGLQIFRAFPSFDPKLPNPSEIPVPAALGLGSWLGAALDWHLTFSWFYTLAILLYLVELIALGGWRRLWIQRPEWSGIWPMIRHYFLGGPRPEIRDLYNPLQKAAYLSMLAVLLVALVTGFTLALPVQFGWVVKTVGGWQAIRVIHFACLCAFGLFLPGHLIMVVLAGKGAMRQMLTGAAEAGR